jgi:hypothetical protein
MHAVSKTLRVKLVLDHSNMNSNSTSGARQLLVLFARLLLLHVHPGHAVF